MITLRRAVKSLNGPGRQFVLCGVDAHFPRGQSTGILGAAPEINGALMRLFAGADVLDQGTIRVNASVSWPLGYGAAIGGNMSARDAAMFVARLYGERPARVVRFVEDFADIGSGIDRSLKELRPELRNRVHTALSLSIDFDCYLVEGVGGKGTPEFRQRCWEMLNEKQNAGADIILATQVPRLVLENCDVAAVLDNGTLTFYGDVQEAVVAFRDLAGGDKGRKKAKTNPKGIAP